MSKYFASKIMYLLLLIVFLVVPATKSWAGIPGLLTTFQNTETTAPDLLVYYWDLRDRESFLQVTNLFPITVTLHVQIFDSATNCLRVSFFDNYTRNDTHTYDMRNIQKNADGSSPVITEDGGYGFVVISTVATPGLIGFFEGSGDAFFAGTQQQGLIGNFRIIDNAGYEYRTNAVGTSKQLAVNGEFSLTSLASGYSFNYNDEDGTHLSDVIGIPMIVTENESGVLDIFAGAPIVALFNPTYYNTAEDPRDCPNIAFSCATELTDPIRSLILGIGGITTVVGFNLGINPNIPNSRGEASMCSVADTSGWVDLDNLVTFFDPDGDLLEPISTILGNFFVGFVGINNGTDVGSMDSWHQRACLSDFKDIFTGNDLQNGCLSSLL